MLLRLAGVGLLVAAVTVSAAAEDVTSNRGVACVARSDAVELHTYSDVKDHAGWARRSQALMGSGKCVLLLRGTPVMIKGPPAEGLVEIMANSRDGPLWTEAANVGVTVPEILPENMGERRKAPEDVLACKSLGTIVDARQLRAEADRPAEAELIRREVAAGDCRLIRAGAEVIWQKRERAGLAIVREVGSPDRLWIDEVLWLVAAGRGAPAANGKP